MTPNPSETQRELQRHLVLLLFEKGPLYPSDLPIKEKCVAKITIGSPKIYPFEAPQKLPLILLGPNYPFEAL